MLAFEHLHTHSHYSLLDGLSDIRQMCEVAVENGQRTVALTDHGSIAGIPELFRTAKEYGLKPIAGMEAYFTPDITIKDKTSKTYHLTLLAKNLEGYRNLVSLVNASYKDGFYGKPRIDYKTLYKHKGLIVLSGCINSHVARTLLGDKREKTAGDIGAAQKQMTQMYDVFTDDFYLEFMDHGIPEQKTLNATQTMWMKKNHKLKGVVTQDSHYIFKEDANVHQTLLCVGTRSTTKSPAFTFSGGPYDYCDSSGLSRRFERGLLLATNEIAEKCGVYDIPKTGSMPVLSTLALGGRSANQYLEAVAWEGLKKRGIRKGTYVSRLREELTVVYQLKYSTYFIMVADVLRWARSKGILVGPGRGSSAGSLLAYCLEITDIDPIKHELYFERFLNKDRVSPPDIDVDIADSGRQEVLQYVREKYGEEKVAHIGSFSAMGPRQSIRDVAIAHGMGYEQVNGALKEAGHNPLLKFEEISRMSAIVKSFKPEILKQAERLTGKYRHMSTHAAGVIIDNNSLSEQIPLMRGKDGAVQTMYNMDELARLGFTKFDILGLKTLGVISDVIKKANLHKADIKAMHALDDEKVYDLICSGRTMGVFQLEGWGYVKMIKRYRPRNFEDIMMINALYRPGPMQGGEGLEIILRRRNGEEDVTFKHPDLKLILQSTYGLPVFQEQVMQMCQVLAGFTMAEADNMRSAIGKKDEVKLAGQRAVFIRGCLAKGHKRDFIDEIFEDITFFNRYGWNRAHAAAYGAVTYYTAWLKTYYPQYFMAALINHEKDHERLMRLKGECHALNIEFNSVDVNKSEVYYTVVEPEKYLLPGFANVKGVGEKAAMCIVAERLARGRFYGKDNFRNRIPAKVLNKTMYAALERDGGLRDIPDVEIIEEVPF